MMKIYYASVILVQVLLAILLQDKNKMAYMVHLLEDVSGAAPSTGHILFSNTIFNFWKKQTRLRTLSPLSSR